MPTWEDAHADKLAFTQAVLAGATMRAVARTSGQSVKSVSAAVHAVCQRRNPAVYYAEVIRLYQANTFLLSLQPSLTFLREHCAAFGFAAILP